MRKLESGYEFCHGIKEDWEVSDLETLLMNEIRKPLEQMQRNNIGYIDGETSNEIYYKIDERIFRIRIKEVDSTGNPLRSIGGMR